MTARFYIFGVLIAFIMLKDIPTLNPDTVAFSTHNGSDKSAAVGDSFIMAKRKPTKDLTGLRFKGLIVLERANERNGRGRVLWLCKCDCGKLCKKTERELGTAKSCGCLIPKNQHRPTKHGMTETNEYNIWSAMKRRCTVETCEEYKDYGARGVGVCDRWLVFENFYADMGKRPKGKTLDRYPDNDGNYEPSNCRWATAAQQASNRRSNKWFEYEGLRMTQKEWPLHLKANHQNFARMVKDKSFEYAYNYYKYHRRNPPKRK